MPLPFSFCFIRRMFPRSVADAFMRELSAARERTFTLVLPRRNAAFVWFA